MSWLTAFAGYAAPIFLVLSPILSYSDQALAMHRQKSSAGFSLDIPLIMIVASLLRMFYYPGAHFDQALLIQAFIMVAVQAVLLKIALDNRPGPAHKGGEAALPFAGAQDGLRGYPRPYNFWRWRSHKPYWQSILYFFICLTILELVLSQVRFIYAIYSPLIGYIGLAVEATLPLPQMAANARLRSCKGFRPSVIVSWIMGDAMKMYWFFTSTTEIPTAFKVCGVFQAACDLFLGAQYLMYGEGEVRGIGNAIGNGAVQLQNTGGGGAGFTASTGRVGGLDGPAGRRTPSLSLDKEFD